MMTPETHKESIRNQSKLLGFHAFGVADACQPLGPEFLAYESYVANGYHGEMSYVANFAEVRKQVNTAAILDGARSVVCLAFRYARPEIPVADPENKSLVHGIARYAHGRDYHNSLRKKLQKLAAFVRSLAPDVQARAMIDTAPVLERAWAMRAGLGFIGKNGMLITPGQGSYSLLGEVVTTLELPPDQPMRERCGSCTRCLDACPTQAFAQPFVLDARSCLAYLTIELRDSIEIALRSKVGEHLFGCDVCQEVCPFNKTSLAPVEQTELFSPFQHWLELHLEHVLVWNEAAWAAAVQGSPLSRPGYAGFLRNAILVAVHQKRVDLLPTLRDLHRNHGHEMVREHAAWAVEQMANIAETMSNSLNEDGGGEHG
jgi:epoxyqueuosine reductase